jgi:hypothetical protein
VNFYLASSFAYSPAPSDSCIASNYDSTTFTNTATQIGAGAYVIASVSGNTDSLYKAATGDLTYHSSHSAGLPFNPGDSVFFSIAGDLAGFPQMQGRGRTAEPFIIVRPTNPPFGQPMVVQWTPTTDNNAAMYVALIYNSGGGTALNTQIFCDFHDDGQGSVQASLLPQLAASAVPFVVQAQRVRSNLVVSSTTPPAYLDIISTFMVPTPVSP